ncbi:MAG: 2-oxo acid dehydrogenase subunit E2 [Enterobacterales bacterium]
MSVEVNVPDIGSDKLEVVDILFKVGDVVKQNETLISLEGNKIFLDVPSPINGIIESIEISIGDKIKTGTLIMLFKDNTYKVKSIKKEICQYSIDKKRNKEKEIKIYGLKNDKYQILEMLVKKEDIIQKKQPILKFKNSINTIYTLYSPYHGVVKNIKVKIGDIIRYNKVVILISLISTFIDNKLKNKNDNIKQKNIIHENNILKIKNDNIFYKNKYVVNNKNYHATPIIRRIAREFNIDISLVNGSGRKGRITKEDINNYIKNAIDQYNIYNKNKKTFNGNYINNIDYNSFGEIEVTKLSNIKKISGQNLYHNWITIPHVTQFDEVDITDLESFRKNQNINFQKDNTDIKITVLIFIIKSVAKALVKFPKFNSSLSLDKESLILKKYVNIGIAVNTNYGLVVPVLRNVNKKSIIEISFELSNIIKKSHCKKLNTYDISGGNFTISNLGSIVSNIFTPIINGQEVAILGVSRAKIQPIWINKKFIPRLMVSLSLSYDHRVIDGYDGAIFIKYINDMLSDIRCLIM